METIDIDDFEHQLDTISNVELLTGIIDIIDRRGHCQQTFMNFRGNVCIVGAGLLYIRQLMDPEVAGADDPLRGLRGYSLMMLRRLNIALSFLLSSPPVPRLGALHWNDTHDWDYIRERLSAEVEELVLGVKT